MKSIALVQENPGYSQVCLTFTDHGLADAAYAKLRDAFLRFHETREGSSVVILEREFGEVLIRIDELLMVDFQDLDGAYFDAAVEVGVRRGRIDKAIDRLVEGNVDMGFRQAEAAE